MNTGGKYNIKAASGQSNTTIEVSTFDGKCAHLTAYYQDVVYIRVMANGEDPAILCDVEILSR